MENSSLFRSNSRIVFPNQKKASGGAYPLTMITHLDLLKSYQRFVCGKRKKQDVQKFILNSEEELTHLFKDVSFHTYKHGNYTRFKICDPKLREIDKAPIRDRVVHQLVYDYLVGVCDKKFFFHSYASRKNKGSHRAVKLLREILFLSVKNYHCPIFILKCDIKRFFSNINKSTLTALVKRRVSDDTYLFLIGEIINSFNSNSPHGVPLGNVTSQIFANIYLNELDGFVKHELRIKYYIRYMDDFVIIGESRDELKIIAEKINNFLKDTLKIELHPEKLIIRKARQGIDFLGYVIFPYHILLRTKTKRRMFKKIKKYRHDLQRGLITRKSFNQGLQSYFGVLKHCFSFKLKLRILNLIKIC